MLFSSCTTDRLSLSLHRSLESDDPAASAPYTAGKEMLVEVCRRVLVIVLQILTAPHRQRSSQTPLGAYHRQLGPTERCLCSFTEIQVRPLRHSRYSNQTYGIISNFAGLALSQRTQMLISVDAVCSSSPPIQRHH